MRQLIAKSSLMVLFGCQLALLLATSGAQAGQGCPFDDGSCQEYCGQQGCNMGYCGHFAWIQCICRKCGDEWSWYDKVHYNPDKTVNQTELDSLKLNATSPLILTNSSTGQQQLNSSSSSSASPGRATGEQLAKQPQPQRATLTTLLIPDLSDSSKLDLNDIPDENSDKFLDYLAKNHERLVQATSSSKQQDDSAKQTKQQQQEDQLTAEEAAESASSSSPLSADDETVEIQISSNNNNNSAASALSQQTIITDSPPTTSTTTSSSSGAVASSVSSAVESTTSQPQPAQQQQQQSLKSPLIRLLHMASEEQLFDTSEQ